MKIIKSSQQHYILFYVFNLVIKARLVYIILNTKMHKILLFKNLSLIFSQSIKMGCINPHNNIEVTSIASPPNDHNRWEVVFSFSSSSRIKVHCAATLALPVLVTHPCDQKRCPTACFWGRDCWVHLCTGGEKRFRHINFDLIKIMLGRNQED